jgi:hypothetical protein
MPKAILGVVYRTDRDELVSGSGLRLVWCDKMSDDAKFILGFG